MTDAPSYIYLQIFVLLLSSGQILHTAKHSGSSCTLENTLADPKSFYPANVRGFLCKILVSRSYTTHHQVCRMKMASSEAESTESRWTQIQYEHRIPDLCYRKMKVKMDKVNESREMKRAMSSSVRLM
jgi:hypothetical protein